MWVCVGVKEEGNQKPLNVISPKQSMGSLPRDQREIEMDMDEGLLQSCRRKMPNLL